MHWHVVERLLFIYSKLNPGIKYVQVTIKFIYNFENVYNFIGNE